MRNHLRALLVSAVVCTIAGVAYAAASFHFADASVQSNGDLAVSFKETGLGNLGFSSVTIDVTAEATVTCQCVNKGGKCPSAANKASASGLVSGGGNFPVSNGNTTGTITVHPPVCAPTSPSCTPQQTLEITSVTYSDIMIKDESANDGPIATTPPSVSGPSTSPCP